MKVIFDHNEPFLLAGGGLQIQIEQTMAALQEIGIDTSPLKWWEPGPRPDLIHFFGVPPLFYLERAHNLGIAVVITRLLTTTCNRSNARLAIQAIPTRLLLTIPAARSICEKMGWLSLRKADLVVVGLKREQEVLQRVWGIRHPAVVPLGLHNSFFDIPSTAGGFDPETRRLPSTPFLVAVGSICRRKFSLEIARAAKNAGVPMVFIGAPLDRDSYLEEFTAIANQSCIRWLGHIDNPAALAHIYHAACGFVHWSDGENWCLAAHEAAMCGCHLLLRKQPWSLERFSSHARFWRCNQPNASEISDFYQAIQNVSRQKPPGDSQRWTDVAKLLRQHYKDILEFPSRDDRQR